LDVVVEFYLADRFGGAFRRSLDAGKRDGSIREDAAPDDFRQFTAALRRPAPERTQPMPAVLLHDLDAPPRRYRRDLHL